MNRLEKLIALGLVFVLLTGAVITGGSSGINVDVDTTSRAMRVTLYDPAGNHMAQKATYHGSTDPTVAAPASSTQPFFIICGSGSKVVRVQFIRITGPSTTTLAIQGYTSRKYSTAPTGGTAVALTKVPLDSGTAAATASLVQVYTAAPTAGTLVGVIASVRMLNKSTTVVDGSPMADHVLDFTRSSEGSAVVLRGTAECLGTQLHVATATTVSLHVEWTEE